MTETTETPPADRVPGAEAADVLELTVAEMTYGASALARTAEGQVAFVDDALPGERVRASISKRRRILPPDPGGGGTEGFAARVEPPCPYVPDCGGCQWQHAAYDVQLR